MAAPISFNSSYAGPQETQKHLPIDKIANGLLYFRTAQQMYRENPRNTEAVEMMSKGVRAFLRDNPLETDQALGLVDEMPEGAAQRDYVYQDIADSLKTSDPERAEEVAKLIGDFMFFAITLDKLNPDAHLPDLLEKVRVRYPDLTEDDIETVNFILLGPGETSSGENSE